MYFNVDKNHTYILCTIVLKIKVLFVLEGLV